MGACVRHPEGAWGLVIRLDDFLHTSLHLFFIEKAMQRSRVTTLVGHPCSNPKNTIYGGSRTNTLKQGQISCTIYNTPCLL